MRSAGVSTCPNIMVAVVQTPSDQRVREIQEELARLLFADAT